VILALLLAQALPTPPKDWTIEVVARAPAVRHPSIVACAPDGRVFVGEDPMDISAPADAPLGRILCLHPDGRLTVFADRLHAPFGLLYLEGKLYVHHSPRFSVFEDAGDTGRNRVDLIECTNPKPWALDWNDHVPANVRLAMDGFLYMSVGDKGVYGAVGRDGKPARLHGGGVLRLRPDATEIEVYSTGTRNHLDVAINAEDDVFTYDNTDEKDWWSRVTHMVDGGYYAYPWEHKPLRSWALPAMAEYGAGAATATVAYAEDALPEEYRGNLFLADFGKLSVLRLRIARDGATYKVVAREPFLENGPADFRPVGLALGADGRSFYIGDWNHADSKSKAVRGRLIKVSYTGPDRSAPKPAWYLPAATGKPFEATNEDLAKGLFHPSHAVRLTAQRRLADRKAIAELEAALARGSPHAVWGLDTLGISRPEALAGPARLQVARQLGTRRVKEAVPALLPLLRDPDAAMRFQAATALGRIGDAAAVPALLDALDEADRFARFAAWTALRRIGAWEATARGLESANPKIREGVLFALRETYDEGVVRALAARASRPEVLETLAGLHRKTPEWKGEWWAYHPVNLPRPAKTVEWTGTKAVLEALSKALGAADPAVRRAAVIALRQAGAREMSPRLREAFGIEKDPDVRRSLLFAFGAFKDAEAVPLAESALSDPGTLPDAVLALGEIGASAPLIAFLRTRPENADAVLSAVESLGRLKARAAAEVVAAQLAHRDAGVQTAAARALGEIGAGAEALRAALDGKGPEFRKAALRSLGRIGDRAAVPALVEAFRKAETEFEAAEALARMPDARAIDAYLFGLGTQNAPLRDACRKAVQEIAAEALPEIERRLEAKLLPPAAVGQLQRVYSKERSPKLHAAATRKFDPAAYLEFAMKNAGDAERGRKIYFDPKGLACFKCHRVRGEGGEVGPDHSGIGLQFPRKELAEQILYPSAKVREGYQQVVVRMKDGRIVSGAVKSESPDELVLIDAELVFHKVRKGDIEARRTSELSLMPDGLAAGLSPQDFSDLVSFLESLRAPPK
jgi:putative heme-binding domain-containing protein